MKTIPAHEYIRTVATLLIGYVLAWGADGLANLIVH